MSSVSRISAVSRRAFLATAIIAAAAGVGSRAATPVRRRGIRLGFDNFAVRAMKWNARQLVDHADSLACDSVFITDFGPFEGKTDDRSLADLKNYAADKGVGIELGSWSICPSSKTFKKDFGSAEDHLATGLRMAQALGSRAFRVIVGNHEDRLSEGGIAARIADTVAILQAAKGRALDAGVRIAVENHAGDMRSTELKALVERAGPDFVGVNFDSGNACWTLEDPVRALETLAPYVLTTSLRDAMIWRTPEGVAVQWAAMGEGCTDLAAFFDLFERTCPGVTVHVETISGFARTFPIKDRGFWKAFPDEEPDDLAAFLALADQGHALEPFTPPPGADRGEAERAYQLGELARSIRYCRDVLGLGLRA
ncbi:MAG: sugar phosphate isomerase/epimerase [Planctomycetia bacterium]|nr:sugar phosphate isomerase/epimerase [Planctomycetia bacterium]